MLNLLSFSILLFLSISLSWGAISENECPSYDFTSRFGPLRDQKGHGLCWAFSAAALMEEQLCLRSAGSCKSNLSPLDISRCQWTIGQLEEGATITGALKCALNQGGVCPEIEAPFYQGFTASCWSQLMFKMDSKFEGQCLTQELLHFYRKWKTNINHQEVCEFYNSPLEVDKDFSKIFTLFSEFKSLTAERDKEGFSISVNPLTSINKATNESEFLKLVLLPETCSENRLKFSGKIINPRLDIDWIRENPESAVNINFQNILEAFKSNRSVGVSFCTSMTKEYNKIKSLFNDNEKQDCDGHAIVANGMRWNKKKKRCELHLRNSWGNTPTYNGWYDVNELLPATYSTTFISSED